jgi:hypothetical protein
MDAKWRHPGCQLAIACTLIAWRSQKDDGSTHERLGKRSLGPHDETTLAVGSLGHPQCMNGQIWQSTAFGIGTTYGYTSTMLPSSKCLHSGSYTDTNNVKELFFFTAILSLTLTIFSFFLRYAYFNPSRIWPQTWHRSNYLLRFPLLLLLELPSQCRELVPKAKKLI